MYFGWTFCHRLHQQRNSNKPFPFVLREHFFCFYFFFNRSILQLAKYVNKKPTANSYQHTQIHQIPATLCHEWPQWLPVRSGVVNVLIIFVYISLCTNFPSIKCSICRRHKMRINEISSQWVEIQHPTFSSPLYCVFISAVPLLSVFYYNGFNVFEF